MVLGTARAEFHQKKAPGVEHPDPTNPPPAAPQQQPPVTPKARNADTSA